MVPYLVAIPLLFSVITLAPAQQPTEQPPAMPKVINLAPCASVTKTRALKYTLLPDPLDLKPGNAATYWRRAGRAISNVKHKYDPKEDVWFEAPLKDLPRKEISDHLAPFAAALRLADQAA